MRVFTPLAASLVLWGTCSLAEARVNYPGIVAPGPIKVSHTDSGAVLSNDLLSASFGTKGGKPVFMGFKKGKTPIAGPGSELFVLKTAQEDISSSMMKCGSLKLIDLPANPKALKLSERFPGKAFTAGMTTPNGNLTVEWRAILRDGSHYLRQEMTIKANRDVDMVGVIGMQYLMENAGELRISGNTRGSMVVNDIAFAALETPMGINSAGNQTVQGRAPQVEAPNMAQGYWSRKTRIHKGETWKLSSVLGLLEPGQERRSFLAYSERERVMPYRPFCHYNSWYELNINRNNDPNPEKRMNEEQCLKVVKTWYDKMYRKRGISLDAFVWDDGWDEFNSLWDFHKMFPHGFSKINALAKKQGSGIGAWLGPVGGYGSSKQQRLGNWNKKHPDNKIGNFQLSNKEYFDSFVGRCSQMVKDYDMRYFKFDGISANPHAYGPGNEEDAEGIIKVVQALRGIRGNLFINCTVGTWASPFWFQVADSVWRQEGDWATIGEGDKRDQWITYRDRLVYEVFVQGSPLCPINSLMTHGLIVTKFAEPAGMSRDPENVKKELYCTIASGSALQEYYVDGDLMSANNDALWNELALGVKWLRRNADVLDDVHWVGGNPWNKEAGGSIYGWAAWNSEKATLALRNSSKESKELTSTLRKILDIPAHVKGKMVFKDSFSGQKKQASFTGKMLDIDREITFKLEPFEVLVYEGRPNIPPMISAK